MTEILKISFRLIPFLLFCFSFSFSISRVYRTTLNVSVEDVIPIRQIQHTPQQKNRKLSFVTLSSSRKYNHSPSIVQLPNNQLFAVWYAGDKEGGKNMQIRYNILKKSVWQGEKILINRKDVHFAHRRIGNPIAYIHPHYPEQLVVLFVSTLTGWATSYINMIKSYDMGKTYTKQKRIFLGNIMNFSHLVRGKPFFLKDGHTGIPIYHEFINKFGMVLVLDQEGSVKATRKLSIHRNAIQPQIIFFDNQEGGVAFLRNTNVKKYGEQLLVNVFDKNFSGEISSIDIPNKDNSIAVIQHADNLFIVYNDELKSMRLSIALLDDAFIVKKLFIIDPTFSKYPYVLSNDIGLQLIYSSRIKNEKQIIKYCVIPWNYLIIPTEDDR